jgi:hypothetical protein
MGSYSGDDVDEYPYPRRLPGYDSFDIVSSSAI